MDTNTNTLFINKFQPLFFKDFEIDNEIITILKTLIDMTLNNIKYKVTLNSGLQQTHYFVLSEIQYMSNGCIKFEQFAYGKIDTAVVCGNFAVENYR